MSKKLKVGVLFGGRSGEHDISILSARSVINSLDKARYTVVPIAISREGKWVTTTESRLLLEQGSPEDISSPEKHTGPLISAQRLKALSQVDVVFPVLHGPYGEDGTVQGLLEVAGLPYVGAGVLSSAVGMDKAIMKALFAFNGLPVPRYQVVLREDWEKSRDITVEGVEQVIGYPCFVKPANLGSSVGISKVRSREDMAPALDEAGRWGRKLLVEEAIDAREIECSVLGNDEPQASIPGEIVPSREFYDYYAKYHDNSTRLIIPAGLPDGQAAEVQELAIRAFKAIDCSGMARVDIFLSRSTGKLYVNEINTIPGFTDVSMYPKLWAGSGLPYPRLLDRLIELALERHRERH